MKTVITGASGSVGRQLVRDFQARGASLLLVGRDQEKLRQLFPGSRTCTYDELAKQAEGYEGLLHLAVLNNNVAASVEDYHKANVDLTRHVLQAAQSAGIRRLLYVSTVQVLHARTASPYADSKRIATEYVAGAEGLDVRILYPAAVVGETLSGRMAILSKFPAGIRRQMLALYAAITPVADIDDVTSACWDALSDATYPRHKVVARDQSHNWTYLAIKRCVDVIAALTILVPLFWLLVAIWLAVKLQSRGPGIFSQPRIGQNGRLFQCYKFRTMIQEAPNVGSHEVSSSLITPIGAFLRRTKLDELPQAVNILLNQMSLVGPRPSLPNQDLVISERKKLGVLAVKPGITGFAQVRRIDMSLPVQLAESDSLYIAMRSLRLDVDILIQTALGKGSGDAISNSK